MLTNVYKWKVHLGVYPVGTFIIKLELAKDGDGEQPDYYLTIAIGKFVVTIGKYHHFYIGEE